MIGVLVDRVEHIVGIDRYSRILFACPAKSYLLVRPGFPAIRRFRVKNLQYPAGVLAVVDHMKVFVRSDGQLPL